ncbi:unnamed protein product [Pleuronectes platessa]|uniref:Uncharacterized protein n=1 Tax=Pleuronectes platessa TaxID=8262 RepID=A0A9N7UL13_PLEPL|nr:unnamed protein product [Pleuronectes platessa]
MSVSPGNTRLWRRRVSYMCREPGRTDWEPVDPPVCCSTEARGTSCSSQQLMHQTVLSPAVRCSEEGEHIHVIPHLHSRDGRQVEKELRFWHKEERTSLLLPPCKWTPSVDRSLTDRWTDAHFVLLSVHVWSCAVIVSSRCLGAAGGGEGKPPLRSPLMSLEEVEEEEEEEVEEEEEEEVEEEEEEEKERGAGCLNRRKKLMGTPVGWKLQRPELHRSASGQSINPSSPKRSSATAEDEETRARPEEAKRPRNAELACRCLFAPPPSPSLPSTQYFTSCLNPSLVKSPDSSGGGMVVVVVVGGGVSVLTSASVFLCLVPANTTTPLVLSP